MAKDDVVVTTTLMAPRHGTTGGRFYRINLNITETIPIEKPGGTCRIIAMIFVNMIYLRICVLKIWILRFWIFF